MKRKHRKISSPRGGRGGLIDSDRLVGVRGGTDLGITVVVEGDPSNIMTQQHNEALIRLRT